MSEEQKQNFDLPYTVELKGPIAVGSKTYHSLTFENELTVNCVKHLPLDTKRQELGDFMRPIAIMANVPTAVVEKLSMQDFNKCLEVVNSFL